MSRFKWVMCMFAAFAVSLAMAVPASAEADSSDLAAEVAVQQTAGTQQSCSDPVITNPFTAFDDFRDYVLAPVGDFEGTLSGWNLEGGATQVVDADGNTSLSLPAGSTATSPAMCIDLDYPTARFFASNSTEDGDLQVDVMYVDHKKAYKPHKVAKLKAKQHRMLTKDIKINPNRGGKEAGWRRVAFRFVADDDKGDFRIDDFYVDPRLRG